ncbi:pyruvate dehydrogenase complex dihydrolipoamide acetyltransferase [Pseudolysinimonas kribbensis]|uniref:Dihydrolipoamide acetyltransferase component of pyruvate dehydrogenase complex n=1 Tax=Pseudolysinimonas kribbensis TaxID=433641 RepID=A0ABQ6K605_9MICO|nr:dihydrolipoamide acetyltransferase family protein [Pseudolysinimonas kribbensis]GMA95873.1 acetyltransferase component of pyruvate dehydrogenase complex [Pseudolysinimonas kribbensis]
MATVVRMPSVLANVTEGAIQSWLATEGQTVAVGDPLAEIETEKAVVEYAAEVEGTVGRLLVEPGDNLAVGTPIAVILAEGEGQDQVGPALAAAGVTVGTDAGPAPVPPAAVPEQTSSPEPRVAVAPAGNPAPAAPTPTPSPSRGQRTFASPLARRLARERGIDIAGIDGTGPDGRITRRDIERVPASSAPQPTAPAAASGDAASFTDEKLTGMRRAIARRLTESKTTVPHFYVTAHVRVDRLLELRREINETAPRKVSVNDLVLKAVSGALQRVPAANAIWNGDSIRRFTGVDIAVAVAIEGGLVTPVVRAVQDLTIGRLSAVVADLAERARAGRLQQHELEGGSFSVSNLGMYGVDEFSAILNPPQSGILAVSAAKPRPVVGDDGALAVATVMTVTLSADHRVIDGAVAAEWMAALVELLEHPVGLLV